MLTNLQKDVRSQATPEKAKANAWFFKTGVGQYGYGDKFLGVSVPEQRKIAKKYKDISLKEVESLLKSEFHEERLIALFILILQFQQGSTAVKGEIYKFYLNNAQYVNNWDLVDASAHKIVGAYLEDKDRSILYKLAGSHSLWERRIAIISTAHFIAKGESRDTFQIADILLQDKHDLIQKAVGWMLREVGKRVSERELITYLKARYSKMPRTTLRYAIERFPQDIRRRYLLGEI